MRIGAALHGLALDTEDFGDETGARRGQARFHLHRLHDDQLVALVDGDARPGRDRAHDPRHRRQDRVAMIAVMRGDRQRVGQQQD